MKVLKFSFSVCFIVLSLFVFGIVASAENGEDAFSYDMLNIVSDNAVLTGQTQQMRVKEYTGTGSGLLVWASNNPSVISCTPEGEIKGLKEGEATISVKAMFGDGYDSITVYCVQKLAKPRSEYPQNPIYFTFSKPHLFGFSRIVFNINPFAMFVSDFNGFYIGPKYNIKGTYGSYFYVEYDKNNELHRCFILQTSFSDNVASEEIFKQLSRTDMNVFIGVQSDGYFLTTNYKGAVKWSVSDNTIIDFDDETGKVEGKKPGIATISATANGKTLTCTVHSIYVWPQDWTGAAREDTYIYRAEGTKYVKSSTTLSVGQKFIVKGDMGGDSSWAYGVSENNVWGYIPISHISTKGTVSQYSGMGFVWPLEDTEINFISSPYGPRSSKNGGNHKGFDITTGNSGEIMGKPVVTAYSGTVKKIYIDNEKQTSHGNAIVITADKIDPVSNKNLAIIYMHLSKWQTNSSGNIVVNGKVIKEVDEVTVYQIIGKAGNTGYNTTGAHLHYEVNNQNSVIRSGSDNPFSQTINPIYFYMDKSVLLSEDCEAASNGNGFYWYSENN